MDHVDVPQGFEPALAGEGGRILLEPAESPAADAEPLLPELPPWESVLLGLPAAPPAAEPIDAPAGLFDAEGPADDTATAPKRRWWTRRSVIAAAVAVAVAGASAGYLATRGPSKQSKYLKALEAANLRGQFTTDRQAVANATRLCADLDAGKPAQGYARDRVGVETYCSDYLASFKVVPTPEEQEKAYLGLLKDHGLAGKFTSDPNALANANRVCDSLKGGGRQEGLAEDQIGVQVYCPDFLSGFHVLEHRTIKGTMTLMDSSPSIYYSPITAYGGTCWGSGGYSDIRPGTEVYVKNSAGTVLGHTPLGTGIGTGSLCIFTFSVDLTEGEDTYLFEVSHRGQLTYTWTQLANDPPAISLGS